MQPSEQAKAILELRHQSQRQPNKPNKYDRQAWPLRVKIDAIKADMDDAKQLNDAWEDR